MTGSGQLEAASSFCDIFRIRKEKARKRRAFCALFFFAEEQVQPTVSRRRMSLRCGGMNAPSGSIRAMRKRMGMPCSE